MSCHDIKEVKGFRGEKKSEEISMGMDWPDHGNSSEVDEELTKFSNTSPGIQFNLTVDNQEAFGFFKPGHSYYLDITEVPMELQPQWLQDQLAKLKD